MNSRVDIPTVALESIVKPTKDILAAATLLRGKEVRFIVDAYYQMQEFRKASANQIRALDQSADAGGAHLTLDWINTQVATMESQIERALDRYTMAEVPGRWCRSIKGLGPVLTANFLAHLSVYPWKCANPKRLVKRAVREEDEENEDAEKRVFACTEDAPCTPKCARIVIDTAGGFWRFAGLDPTLTWGKGERRPFNAALKRACWLASDSWVKLKGHADSYYSRLYIERKTYEIDRNEAGVNSEAAIARIGTVGKKTEAHKYYSVGRLPPGHVDARARRAVVKIFLSHLHHVMYEDHFGHPPPKPFVITKLGHTHYLVPPNWESRER